MEYALPQHRTVLIVDVEGFGDPRRNNRNQVAVRAGLYGALQQAFGNANVPWTDCHHEDRGDGVLVLAPADVPKSLFVESFPEELVKALREHNSSRNVAEQIRLRMALHAGEIRYDDHGVTGASINLTFRLLDAPSLKTALAESPGVLAIVVSSWFFDEVVRHSTAGDSASYNPIHVEIKETTTTAWICLPDFLHLPDTSLLAPSSQKVDVEGSARDITAAELRSRASSRALQPLNNSTGGKSVTTNPRAWANDPARAYRVEQAQHGWGDALPGHAMTRTLPRDTTSFTGRNDEIAQLLESASTLTEAGQVVAIHAIDGMAGVGKTAFAVHVGHLLAERFPHGQLFLRLHAHTPGQLPVDPTDALASLLATAGVAAQHIPGGLDARAAMWRDHLAGKKVLLILDDASGHRQVEPLLPASAGCLVLITSRRRLSALDAAVTLPLDTLPPDQAMALFTRLAGRSIPPSQAESVAHVVDLCGYLPLAISLLAGRLRHHLSWSVAHLAAELTVARDLLAEIRAEDVAVAAAFDLSYRDLPADRQRLFRYLGLHPGTDLEAYAAAALAGVSISEARGHLDALYNEHLLDEPVSGRYRMHDLVRDYSRTLIQRGFAAERDQAVWRLFGYYQHTASIANGYITADAPPDGPSDNVAQVVLEVSGPDVSSRVQAWDWMQAERANLLACAAHAAGDAQHSQVIRFAAALATFLRAAGPWDQAAVLHQAAAVAAQRSGDHLSQADALNRLGNVHRLMGNYQRAIDMHSQALDMYRVLDHRLGQIGALNQLGIVRRLTDDYPGATEAHTEALNIARDVDDRFGIAFALNHVGIVLLVKGELRKSIDSHIQALETYRELGDRLGQADALNELGVALRETGNYPGASEAHTQASGIYRELGDGFGNAFALAGLAGVLRVTGDHPGAITTIAQALDIYRELGNRHGQADVLNELGVVLRETGDYSTASEMHSQALLIYRQLGNRLGQAETLNNVGTLLLASDLPRQAHAQYELALQLAFEMRIPLEQARALAGSARCAANLGQFDSALAGMRQALAIYRRIEAAEEATTASQLANLENLNRNGIGE